MLVFLLANRVFYSLVERGWKWMGFFDTFFNTGQAPQKEAKTHDTGLFGFGSHDEYKPSGTTFSVAGKRYSSSEDATKDLDNRVCYSGTLICPVCRQAKNSASEVADCLAEHRRRGYDC